MPRDDQRLAPDVVGEPAGHELPGPQTTRVGGGDDADLARRCAVRGEVERREAPGERVVEVVDEPGLGARAQHRCARSPGRTRCEARMGWSARRRARLLVGDVGARVAHGEDAISTPATAISAAPTQTTVRGA